MQNSGEIFRLALMGRTENADYKEQEVPNYRGNLLLEALPKIFRLEEVNDGLRQYPDYNEEQRGYDSEVRLHLVQELANYVEPLPRFFDLQWKLSRLIRHGLKARNPLAPEYAKQFRVGFKSLLESSVKPGEPNLAGIRSTANGLALFGVSGIGKSTATDKLLLMYPQVIEHCEFKKEPFILKQIVWLKLNCPHNGSLKSLCFNFFQTLDAILGTEYFHKFCSKNTTTEILIPKMAHIASLHCIGVLVIDEIQNLNEAASGGAKKMLNFFTELINTIGLPVWLIGTYRSLQLFKGGASPVRRVEGQGDVIWDRMPKNDEWDFFLNKMWKYQWTNYPTPFTEAISNRMYELSQGIPDIAVKLFMLSQWKLITRNIYRVFEGQSVMKENITLKVIQEVFDESLRMIRPMLLALKLGKHEALEKIDDLVPNWLDLQDYLNQQYTERVQIYGVLRSSLSTTENVELSDKARKQELLKYAFSLGVMPEDADNIVEYVLKNSQTSEDIVNLRWKLVQAISEGMVSNDRGA